jgi:hypothetical protein
VSDQTPRTGGSSTEGTAKLKRKTHFWLRWTHVYTSMISLIIVMFFGITGITLNHPDWTFGTEAQATTDTGILPVDAITDGEVEFLVVSEFVRNTHGVKGHVTNFGTDGAEGTISFKNPGYGAEIFFNIDSGTYSLSQNSQGWVTAMNDLHKGRDSNTAWRWVIDVSGGLLVLISVTGLGIQFFLRKRRLSALSLSIIGAVLSAAFIWIALR